MSDTQTAVAESSPAVEVDRGPLVTWTKEQRTEFRNTGKMPTAKVEESPASDPEQEPESEAEPSEAEPKPEGDPEPPKPKQETQKRSNADTRKAQLAAEIQGLLKQRDSLRAEVAPKAQRTEPPPVAPQQATREKPKPEDTADGKPKYSTYEEYVEDLADWKAEQRIAREHVEQAKAAQVRELNQKVSEARDRYENFDEVLQPALTAILGDQAVNGVVKTMLNESEVLPDLMFTIGSDAKTLSHFVEMAKSSPGQALRYIALTESLIRDELDKGTAKNGARSEIPAKPETRAPRPPAEVGGRNTAPPDALESAVQANDFRAAKAEMTRRALAKLKS